jgi:transposase-like protein
MTENGMPLPELLRKRGGGDFLRELAEAAPQRLMELEAEGIVGAGCWERSEGRTRQRNGYRDRNLETRLGTLDLRIPKLRRGSCFPAFLKPRKTAERAPAVVVREAWIQGLSTRKADDPVQAMGMSGISKSQVSRLCSEIDGG